MNEIDTEMLVAYALKIDDKVVRAKFVATVAHTGQARSDGAPYITHVYEVAQRAVRIAGNIVTDDDIREIMQVSFLHDVLEDSNISGDDLARMFDANVCFSVYALTKRKGDGWDYAAYVRKINKDRVARIVKLADLEHNMSDLKPGNLYDKYRLTQYMLGAP